MPPKKVPGGPSGVRKSTIRPKRATKEPERLMNTQTGPARSASKAPDVSGSVYRPPEHPPTRALAPIYDAASSAAPHFEDHPDFAPRLTPAQCIRAGIFGGCYFHPKGGKQSVLSPDGVAVDHSEFPAAWFEGLPESMYRSRRYVTATNRYGVKCGKDQAFWETSGWIQPQDPRGWFQWYCRFYEGRRTEDDARQISRWMGVAGPKGRWKTNLVNKVVRSGKHWNDPCVSPVVRQVMLHWAYEIDEADVREGVSRNGMT